MANGTEDKVHELQTKLYQAAKSSPQRRFHALFDKVHRMDFLWRAWAIVARNGGAPGVDGVSIKDIEADLSRWSAEDLEAVALAMNNRPRKVLGWKTPAEVFNEHLLS